MALLSIIFISLAAIAAAGAFAIFLMRERALSAVLKCGNQQPDFSPEESVPSLTVVAMQYGGEGNLEDWLEKLCRQDYPNYNVVFVADMPAAEARALRERCASRFPKVHFTFAPPGELNLSRRKLALTIGMKAADGEYVLTTATLCEIKSESWLSQMMQPIVAQGKEITLGLTRPDFRAVAGVSRWYKEFDFAMRTLQWVSAAAAGKAFRGDGFNLLFRRQLFFDVNGYSSTAYLNVGEDDLFLTEIAERGEVGVEISPDTILEQRSERPKKHISELKEQYDFTSRMLPRRPFLLSGLASCCRWLSLGCAVAASLIALPDFIPAILSGIIILALWGSEIWLYRRTASGIGVARLWWAVVPFLLWRPIGNMLFRMKHRSLQHLHYTNSRIFKK